MSSSDDYEDSDYVDYSNESDDDDESEEGEEDFLMNPVTMGIAMMVAGVIRPLAYMHDSSASDASSDEEPPDLVGDEEGKGEEGVEISVPVLSPDMPFTGANLTQMVLESSSLDMLREYLFRNRMLIERSTLDKRSPKNSSQNPYLLSSECAACARSEAAVDVLSHAFCTAADMDHQQNGGGLETHWERLRVLVEAKADLSIGGVPDVAALRSAISCGHRECLDLVVEAKADISAKSIANTEWFASLVSTPESYPVLQHALELGMDLNAGANDKRGGCVFNIIHKDVEAVDKHRFMFLMLCGNLHVDLMDRLCATSFVAQYKLLQDQIGQHHYKLHSTLSRDVIVDKRIGLGRHGIYHEPLERALEYMGLSLNPIVLNKDLDEARRSKCYLHGSLRGAKYWFDRFSDVRETSDTSSLLYPSKSTPFLSQSPLVPQLNFLNSSPPVTRRRQRVRVTRVRSENGDEKQPLRAVQCDVDLSPRGPRVPSIASSSPPSASSASPATTTTTTTVSTPTTTTTPTTDASSSQRKRTESPADVSETLANTRQLSAPPPKFSLGSSSNKKKKRR